MSEWYAMLIFELANVESATQGLNTNYLIRMTSMIRIQYAKIPNKNRFGAA